MKRIQRMRTKGWKMPPNTVYVGRPTKWGNPYKLREQLRKEAIEMYEIYLQKVLQHDPKFLDPLEGKDLACWCPLNKSCHADVIIKVMEEREIDEVSRALSDQAM